MTFYVFSQPKKVQLSEFPILCIYIVLIGVLMNIKVTTCKNVNLFTKNTRKYAKKKILKLR